MTFLNIFSSHKPVGCVCHPEHSGTQPRESEADTRSSETRCGRRHDAQRNGLQSGRKGWQSTAQTPKEGPIVD